MNRRLYQNALQSVVYLLRNEIDFGFFDQLTATSDNLHWETVERAVEVTLAYLRARADGAPTPAATSG